MSFEKASRGPLFDVRHEQFADSCPMGRGEGNLLDASVACNFGIALSYLRGAEGAPNDSALLATLVCHGLRRTTDAEQAEIRVMWPDRTTREICNLAICYSIDPERG